MNNICQICLSKLNEQNICENCAGGEKEYRSYEIFKMYRSLRTKELKIGVELEVETKYDYESTIDHRVNILSTMIKKHIKNTICGVYEDGSLFNGNEFITAPMYISYYYSNNFKKLFSLIMRNSKITPDCGCHININNNQAKLNISNIKNIYFILYDFFIKNQKKFYEYFNRDTDALYNYCNLESYIKGYGSLKNKYNAVSYRNPDRIEFRIFGGTNKYRKFLSYIELIQILIKCSKNDIKQFNLILDSVVNSNFINLKTEFYKLNLI